MKFSAMTLASLVLLCGIAQAEGPKHLTLQGVPFTDVKFTDEFWAPRMETNRVQAVPHNIEWCERTQRMTNFDRVAKKAEGKHQGCFWDDSDPYKVIEGASYTLATHPDPALEKKLDEMIARIAAAQLPDGYLHTFYTLTDLNKRWTEMHATHELYCAGHMIEGAVAHYRATGKRNFLDVAIKFADYIDATFGPTKRHSLPGHEEIELALVKLYQATGEEKYLNLAQFFIDMRGNKDARDGQSWGPYCQDHMPIREQSEIEGHAVRATYLYAGVADVAAYSGDQQLIDAMGRLWQDVVQKKMYITGGIGAEAKIEGFGQPYQLPNDAAYCETCAAIGLAFWAHRLNLLHGDAQYADVVEQELYNNVLSGVSLDGKKYFYGNPLVSHGNMHRQEFFDCACCPPNVVRILASLPGYAYASNDRGIFVNVYAAGAAKIALGNQSVSVSQETRYPWDGRVKLTMSPEKAGPFTLGLRIPGWCKGAEIAVNGQPVALDVRNGYAQIERLWKADDTVALDLPMPVERIEAHPAVAADVGRVALQRGPVLYCFESVDNGGPVRDLALPVDPKFTAEHRGDLLGGVTVITGVDAAGRKITAVPYYAWENREPGDMVVWVQQTGKATQADVNDATWQGKLYRPLDPTTLSTGK